MSVLPRFLVLEMISDMTTMEEFLLPQQFHKIYVHHYKDVRYTNTRLDQQFSNRWDLNLRVSAASCLPTSSASRHCR